MSINDIKVRDKLIAVRNHRIYGWESIGIIAGREYSVVMTFRSDGNLVDFTIEDGIYGDRTKLLANCLDINSNGCILIPKNMLRIAKIKSIL